MATQISGYYTQGGILYKEGEDSTLQMEAHRAQQVAAALIRSNEEASSHTQEWLLGLGIASDITGDIMSHTVADPWFWLSISLLSQPHGHFNPEISQAGCCTQGPGCSGGNGGNGEGCLALILVMAIAALVIAIAVCIGFTVKQGLEADEARKNIEVIKELQATEKRTSANLQIQEAYAKVLPILELEYIDKSFKTGFTAIIAGGFGLLTASAALALYAVIQRIPFPQLTQTLAIVGGSVAGGGIFLHAIRPIVKAISSKNDLEQYRALFEETQKLRPMMIHPYEVLRALEADKAYFILNDKIYVKNGSRYSTQDDRVSLNANYAYREIENRG